MQKPTVISKTTLPEDHLHQNLTLAVKVFGQSQIFEGLAQITCEDWKGQTPVDVVVFSTCREPPNAEVTLDLTMPRSQTKLTVKGKVVWSDQHEGETHSMGVQVIGFPLERLVLERFLTFFPSV